MKTLDFKTLQPGDCLLYRPGNLLDWIVAIKTGARITHVEVYVGDGTTISSRPSTGVGVRPVTTNLERLAYVRRPVGTGFVLDPRFNFAIGKKYDWRGLLGFFLGVRRGSLHRWFCSELATMIYRDSWFQPTGKAFIPFNPQIAADHFSPADFYNAGTFETIWRAGN